MRRVCLIGLMLLTLATLVARPAAAQSPTTIDARAAAFTYSRAWYTGWPGVALAHAGTVTFSVRSTAALAVEVWAQGQTVAMAVDGRWLDRHSVSSCGCFEEVQVLDGLSAATHRVLLKNTSPTPLRIRSWTADAGGRFVQVATNDDSLAGSYDAGAHLTFFVAGARTIKADVARTGTQVSVRLDDRWDGPDIGIPAGDSEARLTLAWGLSTGVHQVTIVVWTGTLTLDAVVLFAAAGHPTIVDLEVAAAAPLLTVFGDSITEGLKTLGELQNSDGYADELARLRGWRLANLGVRASSGACYGLHHVNQVISTNPQEVIVAYGFNDMIPGPDYAGCDPTLDQFRLAMDSLIGQLQQGLPDVPLYVAAILPSDRVTEETRAAWNAVLQEVSDQHAVPFVDPSSVLAADDFADGLHPNTLGHLRIANYWNEAIPA